MLDYIRVGKIVNTHGLKGYLKCFPLTDNIKRFDELIYVYIDENKNKRFIDKILYKKGMVYIKFKDINNINEAEKLKDQYIYIDNSQSKELPENSYYIFDIIGMKVYDLEGLYVGEITQVLQPGANDVYVVEKNNKQFLIPAIKDVVKEINIKKKIMTISIIEGLIE